MFAKVLCGTSRSLLLLGNENSMNKALAVSE